MRLFVVSLAIAAAVLAGSSGAARGGTPVVLDRTYCCAVAPAYDDVRQINFGARNQRETPAPEVPDDPASVSVGARRGGYGERPFFSMSFGPGYQKETGSISIDPKACSRVGRPTIPLVSRGLPGPPVLFEQYVACPATRAVLVRVRAIVDRTPRWQKRRGYLVANVNSLEGKVAVRTLSQRPIGFVSVLRGGATKTYYSSACEN